MKSSAASSIPGVAVVDAGHKALAVDSGLPLVWQQPGLRYAGASDDAAARKFERDKAELLELGLPLQWVQGDDEHPDGYVVDRSADHTILAPYRAFTAYWTGNFSP